MENRPYHHGNLRNALIEAGIELINEEGLKGFSLRKVAAKCNVSPAAPYSHFKDVDDLIRAMGRHVTEQFTENLRASIRGKEESPEAITLLGRAYISFFMENPQYFQFLFYHSGLTINLDNDCTDDYPPFVVFKETAYRLFRRAGLPQEDFTPSLIALWSMVQGIASLLTNQGIHYSGNWLDAFSKNIVFRGKNHENHCP